MKVYIFAFDHALPTAMAMAEDGNVLCQHAGSDYEDAVQWMLYHNGEKKLKGHELIILDKDLVKKHIYEGAPLETLGEGAKLAFENNQKLKEEYEKKGES